MRWLWKYKRIRSDCHRMRDENQRIQMMVSKWVRQSRHWQQREIRLGKCMTMEIKEKFVPGVWICRFFYGGNPEEWLYRTE